MDEDTKRIIVGLKAAIKEACSDAEPTVRYQKPKSNGMRGLFLIFIKGKDLFWDIISDNIERFRAENGLVWGDKVDDADYVLCDKYWYDPRNK